MCPWFGGSWAGGWFGGGMLMMVPMLLFWGFIIWVGILLVRKLPRTNQNNRTAAASGKVYEILQERYAKGEISRDEFEQMKRDIE